MFHFCKRSSFKDGGEKTLISEDARPRIEQIAHVFLRRKNRLAVLSSYNIEIVGIISELISNQRIFSFHGIYFERLRGKKDSRL